MNKILQFFQKLFYPTQILKCGAEIWYPSIENLPIIIAANLGVGDTIEISQSLYAEFIDALVNQSLKCDLLEVKSNRLVCKLVHA